MRVDRFKNMKFCGIAIALIGILIILSWFTIHKFDSNNKIKIEKGLLILEEDSLKDGSVLNLSGEWEFYWGQLLTVYSFLEGVPKNKINAQVPLVWNQYTLNNKHLPSFGFGTYRLHIKRANDGSELAIRMPTVSTAYKLYIDGELLSTNGKVSEDENDFIPEYAPEVVTFKPIADEFDIILQVSNYTYARGGMWYPLYMGTSSSVQDHDEDIQIKDLLLVGAFLMFAIYHIFMYILRRNEISNLTLVLLSLCAMGRVMIYGDYSINYLLPQVGFHGTVVLDYLTMLWFPALGMIFVDAVFIGDKTRRFTKRIFVLPLALSISILILPISYFTQFTFAYQAASVLMGFYAVTLTVRNLKQNKIERILLFIGAIAITMSGLHDTLYQNNLIHSKYGELSPVGFLVFIILQSIILAIRNKKAYDTLSTVTEKLEKLDALKDEFFANTAHELRTPLNAMINVSEGLSRGVEGELIQSQKENLALIINSGKRLSLIVNEILDYSKIKNTGVSLQLEGVHPRKVAESVMNELRRLNSSEHVQLVIDMSENTPSILADQNRFIQILYNLIGNAIKNTEKGTIAIKALSQGSFVKIIIEDTGIGIPKERLSTIFEPYFQVEASKLNTFHGTGLGLAITQNLVVAHGGEIKIESIEGKGTSVSFTIPIYKGEFITTKEPAIKVVPSEWDTEMDGKYQFPFRLTGKGPTVAVVDDNKLNLVSMIGILKTNEYSIMAFDCAEDFYASQKELSKMDLVILDLMLPDSSGYIISEWIRKDYSVSEMPILMLTAKAAKHDIVEGFKSGANDYLAKPFDAEEFLARVKTLIQMKISVEKMLASELAFLQAQIKPHFLYNAINTFITIARYDVEKAVSLMISFSQYLRKSFDFKDIGQTTSLKDELDLVKSYIEIEKARFEERLEIEFDVTDQMDIRVPILVIQPIVENAIIHGVLPKTEGGKVTISIKIDGEQAVFNVKDNGVGMDTGSITKQEKNLLKNSVGLNNIDGRLRKMYGQGLEIDSEPNIGTSVSWQIPVMKGDKS